MPNDLAYKLTEKRDSMRCNQGSRHKRKLTPFAEPTEELVAQAVLEYATTGDSVRVVAKRFNICRGRLHRAILLASKG